MRFYWGSNASDGAPLPVLQHAQHPTGTQPKQSGPDDPKPVFWPNSGISIAPAVRDGKTVTGSYGLRDVRLVVLGQLVESVAPKSSRGVLFDADSVLAFVEKTSVSFVVRNPFDPADQWKYSSEALPVTPHGQYRW